MGAFERFAIVWATAVALEMTERWREPAVTLAVVALATGIVARGATVGRFLVLLVVTTGWFAGFRFPEVANHVNIILYVNLALMAGMLCLRPTAWTDPDAWLARVSPVLRVSMIVVYAMAGFHKLNTDFFDPTVSCTRYMAGLFVVLARACRTPLMAGVVLTALLLGVALVRGRGPRVRIPWRLALALLGPAIGLAAMVAVGAKAAVVEVASVGVVAWELGALTLLVPWLQGPFLIVCGVMHAGLALVGFADFSSVAFALLLTFVPARHARALDTPVALPLGLGTIHPLRLYFLLNVIVGGGLDGIHFHLAPVLSAVRGVPGIIWDVSILMCLWPLVARVVALRERPRWTGVPIGWRRMPAILAGFPLLLVVYGASPYLGLRTAGTFSMFSNLRTEGPRSNHLLLGTNPLKIWGLQEDAVHVLEIDDATAQIGHQYQPLAGQWLPVIEFRKRIWDWTRAGRAVPMRFEYQGIVHATDDVTRDPRWRVTHRDWGMRLLDFRVIQAEGPNDCRW